MWDTAQWLVHYSLFPFLLFSRLGGCFLFVFVSSTHLGLLPFLNPRICGKNLSNKQFSKCPKVCCITHNSSSDKQLLHWGVQHLHSKTSLFQQFKMERSAYIGTSKLQLLKQSALHVVFRFTKQRLLKAITACFPETTFLEEWLCLLWNIFQIPTPKVAVLYL